MEVPISRGPSSTIPTDAQAIFFYILFCYFHNMFFKCFKFIEVFKLFAFPEEHF